METKLKHLEFIQNVINRMARNSFLLKWWSTTLVAALTALFLKEGNQDYLFVAFFPVAVFWILDGYFLSQETLFRALYDHVRKLQGKIDFSMDTSEYGKNKRNGWLNSMFSTTLLFFYLPMVTIILLIVSWTN